MQAYIIDVGKVEEESTSTAGEFSPLLADAAEKADQRVCSILSLVCEDSPPFFHFYFLFFP